MYIRLTLTAGLLVFAFQSATTREWRGINPLRSTRADVIRILGQCSEHREACVISSAQENVYILFSGGLGEHYQECAAGLPPETVMFIQVHPKTRLKMNSLRLEKNTLKKLTVYQQYKSDAKHFHTDDGLVIEASRGIVDRLVYIGNMSDRRLCPSYYEKPEEFVASLAVHPPLLLTIDSPKSAPAGRELVLMAYASADARHGPTWSVDAGKIVAGQYTYKITVDTTGLGGRKILVSSELSDGYGHFVMGVLRDRNTVELKTDTIFVLFL